MAVGVLFALGTTIAWSLIPFWIRFVLGSFDPLTITASRLIFGGLLFAFILRGKAPLSQLLTSRLTRHWIFIGGAALALNHILYSSALQWTTPAAGVIAVQIQTVAASVLSWIVLGETVSTRKGIGIAAVISGIVIVGWDGQSFTELMGSEQFWGNVAMFGGGLVWGVYAVCQRGLSVREGAGPKHKLPRYDTRDLLAPFFLLAGLLTAPVALPFMEIRGPITFSAVITLAALAIIGTVGGYYCLSQAMNRLPIATAVTITNTSPLVVALISIFFYGETLSLYTMVGGVMAVAGCIGTVRSDLQEPQLKRGASSQ